MTKLKAIVLFDYDAEAADELTLRVGDVLSDIKQVEEGWCQGFLKGKTGMFPDNFVKIEEDKLAAPKPAPAKLKREPQRLLKVAFPYDPQNADELELITGDIIEVLKDEEEGWAQGRVHDKEGVFPTNFCVSYTKSPTNSTVESPVNEEPPAQVAPKKVKGMGFGNIFGEGPVKLKKTSVRDSGDKSGSNKAADAKSQSVVVKPQERSNIKVKPKDSKSEKSAPALKKAKPTVEKCRATFDYTAATIDELSLVKGDVIVVTNKNCADIGWWEGEIVDGDGRKRHGVFPDNFVALLPAMDEELPEGRANEKPIESKPKSKAPEPEQPSVKVKPAPVLKLSNSLKKPAPQAPPPAAKPHFEEINDVPASDLSPVTNSSTEEQQQLTHYKRAGGPKNRRKPDSAGRRERAKEATDDVNSDDTAEVSDSESQQPEPEATPPQITPKRETVRGIQVMPSPTGGSDGGDKPSWMKDLKNRTSQKKAGGAFSVPPPNKPEENTKEAPNWLSNLRKKSKSVDKGIVLPGAPNPGPGATSPKPIGQTMSLKLSSNHTSPSNTNHAPLGSTQSLNPDRSTVEEKNATSWSLKKNMKSKSESDVLAHAPLESPTEVKPTPELKKPPMKPQVALQPPSKPLIELPKKPLAASKPKPPPPKAKPSLPGAKPSAPLPADDIKDDIKSLKEQFANFQAENMKEIQRLTKELDDEKKHRVRLQAEVAQLRKQIG